jgi:chemotaxis family two-component system sensor kinase Cph1
MKIKNQFLASITIFSIIIAIFAASVFISQQQTSQLNSQEALSRDIQNHANNLVYLSSDYFLYHDSSTLTQWQTEFSSLSDSISKISVSSPEEQTLLNKIGDDAQQLNESWTVVALYLENTPLNVTVRNIPVFQADWSIMSAQNQALIFDAQQQSQAFHTEIDQLNLTSISLILALLGIFAAYFITNYLITYRNTLKSISELQNGIAVIGSGNLDYSLKTGKKDEIGEVSKSVNQMAANLKTITASKTELERAQASLRESEQRWETTLASIGDAVISTDTSGKITFMNQKAEELTGWTLAESSSNPVKQVFNIVNEQSRLAVEDPVAKVLEKGIIVGLANHTILIRKDGTDLPIDDSGAPILDRQGKITGVVLIFRDISDRKQAEAKLEEYARNLERLVEERTQKLADSATYARNLIEASLDPLVTISAEGKITDVNRATEDSTGCSRSELIGSDFSQYFVEPGKANLGYKRVFKEGFVKDYPLAIKHKSGKITEVLYNATVYTNQAGVIQGVFAAARDVTERKKAEKQALEASKKMQDSERLAAIGATAGMVGHDIRNPLQAITSDVFLAKSDLESVPEGPEKEGIKESLDGIEKNIEYINKIVQDLQDYARPLNPKFEESDFTQIVQALIAKNNLPKNIKVSVTVAEEARKISADSYFLNRILFNLVTNSVQAMPNGGKLTIKAYKEAKNIVIAVKDTGEGIPEAVKGKMFTLMFTTKSKGQGFGLPVVKRMAESLGGDVTFESQEGKGTTFMVRLPYKRENQQNPI